MCIVLSACGGSDSPPPEPGSIDSWEFPIGPESPEWERLTIRERLDALQMPDDVLNAITTRGLLETCLRFPYLGDIFFRDDYQWGFEDLSTEFNGFPELMNRLDLSASLFAKYDEMAGEIAQIALLEEIVEIGRFSFRHFTVEMMLSQDVVLESLDARQERELVLKSFSHTNIEQQYPDIFGGIHALSTYLLYAKLTVDAPDVNADMNALLKRFILAPKGDHLSIEMMEFLDRYIAAKYE